MSYGNQIGTFSVTLILIGSLHLFTQGCHSVTMEARSILTDQAMS